MTMVSGWLIEEQRCKLVFLITNYKDCFAWDYQEIIGLSWDLVEHMLPIRHGFKPYKQPHRRFNPQLIPQIKFEIERKLWAGFIRTSRHPEWISNIIPVTKKNGKLKVCTNFRDQNLATPKDEYVKLIVDMLVDSAAIHGMLLFMDDYSWYN